MIHSSDRSAHCKSTHFETRDAVSTSRPTRFCALNTRCQYLQRVAPCNSCRPVHCTRTSGCRFGARVSSVAALKCTSGGGGSSTRCHPSVSQRLSWRPPQPLELARRPPLATVHSHYACTSMCNLTPLSCWRSRFKPAVARLIRASKCSSSPVRNDRTTIAGTPSKITEAGYEYYCMNTMSVVL